MSHILARLQLQRALKKHKIVNMMRMTGSAKTNVEPSGGVGGDGSGGGREDPAADTPGGAPVTSLSDDHEGVDMGEMGEARRTGGEYETRHR